MAVQHNTLAQVAQRFLVEGGRIMLDPKGKLESAIDVGRIFLPAVPREVRERRIRVTRAVLRAQRRHTSALKTLVAQHGAPTPNGWQVWEAGQ